MENNIPTTKMELENLNTAINELSDDDLDVVAGGNDDVKGKTSGEWKCPYCGAILYLKKAQDASKHVAQDCPNNPMRR